MHLMQLLTGLPLSLQERHFSELFLLPHKRVSSDADDFLINYTLCTSITQLALLGIQCNAANQCQLIACSKQIDRQGLGLTSLRNHLQCNANDTHPYS